ncbi:alkaline phosphatase family protein [Romboutsia sp. CE17]|uniref:alkaline phosphatase family protein n=1 Tax=Romboutsia sp. CE17 TaxID=2724150 RepID=UPI001442C6F2|nr:alkaline phosphatase family protein [Romboutsia sp. CE17]QJA09121.1 alkaline phosphatase family protein [Romboutsia sp. CE17]
MKKKVASLLMAIMILVSCIPSNSFAQEDKKVIFINMDRTNLENMMKMPFLKEKLSKEGYIGLMNIKGDRGTDDKRSYATIGAGRRANVANDEYINFAQRTDENAKVYESAVGEKAKAINDLTINMSLSANKTGEYGAVLGSLGQTLSENNIKTAVLGNADIIVGDSITKNRNIALIAMDNYGRIPAGNIEDINIEDSSMPFGMRTDYDKLLNETKKYYNESDAIFIELGDTYRLDKYKKNLNSNTYDKMRDSIYSNINNYIESVFKLVDENDVVYITSTFPSDFDYKNKRRLSPVVKFSKEYNGKGILVSATTRRDGIIANLDLGVDILNEYGLSNEHMVGRVINKIEKDDNIDYLSHEFDKIVSISKVRANIVNTFVIIIAASWIIGMLAVFARKKIPYKKKVFAIIKEFIKLGIIMPLAFLVAPMVNYRTEFGIGSSIIITTIVLYIIGRILFKDDIKNMGFFSLITIILIAIDSIFGTYLMQNNIMSYDAMIGARYYGIGNEYEGITIASAVFGFAVLLQYKKIPKWLTIISLFVILITSAYPSMGANVGGAISEIVAYLLFIMLIFDVKLDLKKVVILGLSAVGIVSIFAVLDLVTGSQSHLGGFVSQILVEGPSVIINTFGRKIQMNLKLAQTSIWVNILLAGIVIIGVLIFRPSEHFKRIAKKYPVVFKGFIASMVGCVVTLLVNDSGIVAASTASIYILIPIIIMSINMIIFEDDK